MNPNAEKNAGKSRQIMLNMAASMLSTLVSLAISFVLSPIIIEKLDFEAQGFMTLATDFVSYANIAAMALNSMAGRFITVSLTKGDLKKANEYFNSTMYANMGIVGFLFIPSVLIVLFLDKLINISPALMADVKILFALTFINFFITIVSTTFSTATFAANRLDLQALRSIESQFIRMGILMLTFFLLPIHISYVALASLLQTAYLCITYIHYTKKLLPDIHVSKEYFSLSSVLEILSSGIWNTVMRAGQTLTNGLDILITNLLIGEKEMGYVSTSKMIVISIDTLYETIAAVFTPSLTISFAKDDKEEMLSDLKSAMKLTGFFANIPLCFVIAFGLTFYTVWLPKTTTNDELVIIYILTLLTMAGTIVGGAISPLFNVYTVVNKLKWNSIITLLMGVMNTIIVFILLETTPLSVFAVAGVSSALGIIKNLTFTPMYAAHCLNVKKSTFYPVIIRYIIVSGVMAALFIGFEKLIPVYYNWGYIILSVFACGIAGCIINLLFLFEKKERAMFWDVLGKLLKKRTNLGAKKRRVVAVATTPYQLLAFLFLKDAFLSDTSVDIILTDKTPLLEDLFKSRKLEAYFDNVLFADGRKIRNPYKSALQVLFESLIYNPTTKKIMTGSLGVYDECFYAAPGMPDEIIKEISKTLIKENRDIVFHRFEDGFSSYTVKAEHIISTGSGRDVYKRFLKYDITEKEKDAYLFCPALAESDIGLDLVTIPKDDERIRRVSEICRNIFDIESKVPDEGVIFLGAGTLHETSDPERYKEIVRQLALAAGEGNFVMKPHPRAIYDDIDGIPLYGSDAPFELSMMGGGFEEKTLVSFYSTACITVKLLFNSKCRVIFLYPMSDECFNETLRFDHFFNEAARIFDNIHIAHNLDEAKKLLSEAG